MWIRSYRRGWLLRHLQIAGDDPRVPREQQIAEISRGSAMAKELDKPG